MRAIELSEKDFELFSGLLKDITNTESAVSSQLRAIGERKSLFWKQVRETLSIPGGELTFDTKNKRILCWDIDRDA